MSYWRWWIGVALVGLTSLSAVSAELRPVAHEKSLAGLSVLIEQAWRLHPEAATLTARDAQTQAAAEIADGWTPEAASVSLSNLNDRQNRNIGQQEWEIELATSLWLPGQRAAQAQLAGRQSDELTARRVSLRLELAGQIREAWWALVNARESRVLSERKLKTARQLAAVVQKRFAVGDVSRLDANLAQEERLATESEAAEADAAVLVAEQVLQLLTGTAPPLALADEVLASAEPDEGWAVRHPQLIVARALAQSAQARVKLANATTRAAPELAVRLVRDRADFAESYTNRVGVKLTLPFSSGPQLRRESATAQVEADLAEAELRRIEARLPLELARARRALDVSKSQAVLAEERYALAADNLALAEKSFALGETDLAALLRVRAAAFDADALRNRQRIASALAISRFNQALGVLP